MNLAHAVTTSLSTKQRQSIAESFTPNAFGHVPKVCIWDGSVRSGKTIGSLIAWCIFVTKAPRGGELVIVGRTRESIARNVFGPLTDPDITGDLSRYITYTPGAPTAKMFGRTVHVLGASDVRSEAVLRGLTVAGAYVDEATLVAEPFWVQLLARMSVLGAQIFATTNPDSPTHYLHRTVIKKIEELGYKRFKFQLADNEHLMRTNPQYVEQLALEYSGLWRRRFIDGDWVQAEGAIYDMWDEEQMVVPDEQLPTIGQVLMVGVDFGTTHPTRAYAVGIGPRLDGEGSCLYTLSEFAPKSGLTIGVQSRELQDWLQQVSDRWGRPAWVAVDPAAAHFRVQLFEDGVGNLMPAHNSVNAGILTVGALLATGQLKVSSSCVELIDKIPGYLWDQSASKRGDTAPVKENDDELDAWRYAVYSSRLLWRGKISVTPAREDAPVTDPDED